MNWKQRKTVYKKRIGCGSAQRETEGRRDRAPRFIKALLTVSGARWVAFLSKFHRMPPTLAKFLFYSCWFEVNLCCKPKFPL